MISVLNVDDPFYGSFCVNVDKILSDAVCMICFEGRLEEFYFLCQA